MDDVIGTEMVKQSGEVMKEAYHDLVHPSAQPLGEIISFLPRTIRVWLSGWEKWIINGEESIRLTAEALKGKVQDIPEDKLVEPEPYVAIPAIQQIAYCQNSKELRDLYANLLAALMNADKKWDVHPAFVDIIKQLNPDEAKYLKTFKPTIQEHYSLIDLAIPEGNDDKNNGMRMVERNYTNISLEVLEHPDKVSSYIDNLIRLDIIEVPFDITLAGPNAYDDIDNSPHVQEIKKLFESDKKHLIITHKCFRLTDFGESFIKVCSG